jgi:hypothetical protein
MHDFTWSEDHFPVQSLDRERVDGFHLAIIVVPGMQCFGRPPLALALLVEELDLVIVVVGDPADNLVEELSVQPSDQWLCSL